MKIQMLTMHYWGTVLGMVWQFRWVEDSKYELIYVGERRVRVAGDNERGLRWYYRCARRMRLSLTAIPSRRSWPSAPPWASSINDLRN